MSKQGKKFVIVAGGTGGHYFPAYSLAQALDQKNHKVIFCMDPRGKKYLKDLGSIKQKIILSGGIAGKSKWQKIKSLFLMGLGFIQSFFLLLFNRPKMVIGFGGYPAIPVFFASLILRIPIAIHEQNAVMGRTNRFFAKYAKKIFSGLPMDKCPINYDWVGTPVRSDFEEAKDNPYPPQQDEFRLLVIGGSLGAAIFSELLPRAVSLLDEALQCKLKIIQQCRQEYLEATKNAYENTQATVSLMPFIEHISEEISQAHFVIARAGASTVTELCLIGRPALFVPYPFATDDHQMANATSVLKNHEGISSCIVKRQEELSPEILAELLKKIMQERDALEKSAELIKSLGKSQVAEKICTLLENA